MTFLDLASKDLKMSDYGFPKDEFQTFAPNARIAVGVFVSDLTVLYNERNGGN